MHFLRIISISLCHHCLLCGFWHVIVTSASERGTHYVCQDQYYHWKSMRLAGKRVHKQYALLFRRVSVCYKECPISTCEYSVHYQACVHTFLYKIHCSTIVTFCFCNMPDLSILILFGDFAGCGYFQLQSRPQRTPVILGVDFWCRFKSPGSLWNFADGRTTLLVSAHHQQGQAVGENLCYFTIHN